MSENSSSTSIEIAPLTHRVAAMGVLRVALIAILIMVALVTDTGRRSDVGVLIGYLLLTSAMSATVLTPHRTLAVKTFGVTLLVDGAMLQLGHERIGHAAPTDVIIAAHLIGVCLLASFRTGIKVAVWQSLLVFLAWRFEENGLITGSPLMGSSRDNVAMMDVVVLWMVVLVTSTAASINERELRRRRHDAESLERLAAAFISDHRPHGVTHRLLQFLDDELGVNRAVVITRSAPGDSDNEAVPQAVQLLARTPSVPALPASMLAKSASALLDLAGTRDTPTLALRLSGQRDELLNLLLPDAHKIAAIPLGQNAGQRHHTFLVAEFGAQRWSSGGRVERRTMSTATQAAATAALALSRSELMQRTQRAAVTDALTGLGNRRSFDRTLLVCEKAWREEGIPAALILVDVDFFKSVNDRFGHLVGDEVLKVLAHTMERNSPAHALLARYGGEEFAILIPGADAGMAATVAERVRVALHDIEHPVRITASFGVAAVPEDAPSADELVAVADRALLQAKETGRDRVVLAEAVQAQASSSAQVPRQGHPVADRIADRPAS